MLNKMTVFQLIFLPTLLDGNRGSHSMIVTQPVVVVWLRSSQYLLDWRQCLWLSGGLKAHASWIVWDQRRLEVFTSCLQVTWRDVAGLDEVIYELQDTVILPFQKRHLLAGSKLFQPPKGTTNVLIKNHRRLVVDSLSFPVCVAEAV